jgi:HEPN domain-containing protein
LEHLVGAPLRGANGPLINPGGEARAEKALKAFCFAKGLDIVRTHSLFQIMRGLEENGELERIAKELDLYYISGRYPDAFPAGAPFELITEGQAARALEGARCLFETLGSRLGPG